MGRGTWEYIVMLAKFLEIKPALCFQATRRGRIQLLAIQHLNPREEVHKVSIILPSFKREKEACNKLKRKGSPFVEY